MTGLHDRSDLREPTPGTRVVPIGPFEAIRRHPLIAVLPLILLAAGALAYGLLRTPNYTAEARLSIGRIDLNTPGALSSFVEASSSLAAGYSRAISADAVTQRVSRELSIPPVVVRRSLGATPIPGSAVFSVLAIGSSASDATQLANAGSAALQDYVEQLNVENPNGDRLFRQFKAAVNRAARRQDRVRRLEEAPSLLTDDRKLIRARTAAAAAGLRVETLRANYQVTQQSQSSVSLVQQLTTATSATNDRNARLQLFLFYALAAGGLIGAALATLRVNNEARAAVHS